MLWLRVDRTVCHLPPRSPCSPRSEEVERLSAAKRLVNNIIATELDFLNLTFLPDCSPSFQITTYTQLRELSSINLMLKAVSQENRTDRVASRSTHYIIDYRISFFFLGLVVIQLQPSDSEAERILHFYRWLTLGPKDRICITYYYHYKVIFTVEGNTNSLITWIKLWV